MIKSILLFQILASIFPSIILVGSKWKYHKFKNMMLVLYLFFVIAAPYLVLNSIVAHWQKVFCIGVYAVVMIGGTCLNFYIVDDYGGGLQVFSKKVPGKKEKSIEVYNKGDEVLEWLIRILYILLLVICDSCSILSRFSTKFLYHFFNNVWNVMSGIPIYVYAVFISIIFIFIEYCKRTDYYKTSVCVFSAGICIYSLLISRIQQYCSEVLELSFDKWYIIYMIIILYFTVGCCFLCRTKASLFFKICFIIFGAACMNSQLKIYLSNQLYEILKSGALKTVQDYTIIIFIVLFPVAFDLSFYFNRGKKEYLKMYILDRKYASVIDGADSEGKTFNGEKILGFYTVKWTPRKVLNEGKKGNETIKRIEDYSKTYILDMVYWNYMIETEKEWYFSEIETPEKIQVESWGKRKPAWKDINRQLRLFILNESDIECLDDESFFKVRYTRKYKGKYRYPITFINKRFEH